MNREMAIGETISLPAPPLGWFDHSYAVLWDGNLALVRSDHDVLAAHAHWQEKIWAGDVHARPPIFRDLRIRLSIFDGSAESGAIEVPSGASNRPKVARLVDGRWLVVSPRAEPNEHNARFYEADGTPADVFALGDGILHLCCATDGTFYVGYFDEGVFSGDYRSSSGVAQFGLDGRLLWRYNSDERVGPQIYCYALALDGSTLWCCPYSNFPIIRVAGGAIEHWRNSSVAGARAIAADGDYVLLAGGYGDESDRIALLRLDDSLAERVCEWRLPPLARDAARLVQGRGATLHIVEDGRWTQVSVAAVRAAFKVQS